MKNHTIIKGFNVRKHYILTTPTPVSEIATDDLSDVLNDNLMEKARRLQARRWRKIRHQTA